MATYTDLLRIAKQADGENPDTWGQVVNDQVFELLEDAIAGIATVATTGGTTALTANNGVSDQARCSVIRATGTLASNATFTVPDGVPKSYMVRNDTTGAFTLTIKTTTGTGVTVPQGVATLVRSDGTNVVADANVGYLGGTAPSAYGLTLIDDADATAARSTLGLGSIATQSASSVSITGGSITGITDLAVADGGTGASDAGTARTNLGLGTMATQAASGVAITGGSITGITDLAVADGGTGASDAGTARSNLGAQAASANLTAIAALAVTDSNFIVGNGTTWVAETGATARTSLGLGSLATLSSINNGNWSGTDLAVVNGGTGASDAATALSNLGGQPSSANLTAIAALAVTDSNFIVGNGTTWVAESGATVRTSLGLGSLATLSSINNSNWSGTDLAVANGGTGASDAATALSNLGGQPLDTELTAIAGLTSAADRVPYFTGAGTAALAVFTSAGRALVDDADASAQRTTLGLGNIATRTLTISTSAPSGGADGDIWFVREA